LYQPEQDHWCHYQYGNGINFIYASSSRPLFLNGVIKATFDPLNINTYNIV